MNNMELRYFAYDNRKLQLEAVFSALMKVQMMGLTLKEGMIECPPPQNIHPFRWKAMLIFASNNEGDI